jgi:hypothetical protein
MVAAGDEAADGLAARVAGDAGPQADVLQRERAIVGPGERAIAGDEVAQRDAADQVGRRRASWSSMATLPRQAWPSGGIGFQMATSYRPRLRVSFQICS